MKQPVPPSGRFPKGSQEAIMYAARRALILALLCPTGAALAAPPDHESYFSKQPSVQQQQLDQPQDPALLPGQLLVITPQPYQPPPPPYQLHLAPPE